MSKIYRAIRVLGNTQYSIESWVSMEEAIYRCYEKAAEDGNWSPRQLRQKWWQFWLPPEYNQIELRFLKANSEEVSYE